MSKEKDFKIYRGLQKPFCLFGLKGINVVWGAVGAIGGILAIAIGMIAINLIVGLILGCAVAGYAVYKIRYHMIYGLQDKDRMKGVRIVKNLIKPTY